MSDAMFHLIKVTALKVTALKGAVRDSNPKHFC